MYKLWQKKHVTLSVLFYICLEKISIALLFSKYKGILKSFKMTVVLLFKNSFMLLCLLWFYGLLGNLVCS